MHSSKTTVETFVSNLSPNILDELGMYLNPRMPLKDFRTLGGKMGYTFMRVRNFERETNPTVSMLEDWWTTFGKKGDPKTVTELIKHLEEMKRDDAVDLLKPYEFREVEIKDKHKNQKTFGAYSRDDLQQIRFPEENDLSYPVDAPEAVVSGLQNRIEHIIDPSSTSEMRAQAIPRPMERPIVSDKVALVIGNKDYYNPKLQGLFYPERDAQEVAKTLGELGFKVVSLVNLTLSEMRIAVLSFCRLLGKGVYAVLYYGGHGYEDNGKNYLLPVDADISYRRDASLCAQEILQTIQDCDTALNLLIIDSCRTRLPDRGSRPTFIRRGAKGNNIFAYSCCSEQEAHEERNQENGLYAQHLLRHMKRDVRIENMLMDVARDVSFSNNHYINQRPCHESDAYLDCRLTDPISPAALPYEFRERVGLWEKAHMLPKSFIVLETSQLYMVAEFQANFSNVMEVMLIVSNKTPFTLTKFILDLTAPSPIITEVGMLPEAIVEPNGQFKQVFKLSALQKLPDKLLTSLELYYYCEGRRVELSHNINLGCPLVSSVFTEWDWWITAGRAPPSKCTQV